MTQIGHSIYHHITLEGERFQIMGKKSHRITYEASEVRTTFWEIY